MEQYRQISVKEAMEMVANEELEILYFKTSQGSIDKAKDYTIQFGNLSKKQYFKKEKSK